MNPDHGAKAQLERMDFATFLIVFVVFVRAQMYMLKDRFMPAILPSCSVSSQHTAAQD